MMFTVGTRTLNEEDKKALSVGGSITVSVVSGLTR